MIGDVIDFLKRKQTSRESSVYSEKPTWDKCFLNHFLGYPILQPHVLDIPTLHNTQRNKYPPDYISFWYDKNDIFRQQKIAL